DVADVARAGDVGAGPLDQGGFEAGLIEVGDRLADEVAAADGAVAVHRDDRSTGATGAAEACVPYGVDRIQRVDRRKSAGLVGGQVAEAGLVGIDPEVDVPRQLAPQRLGLGQLLLQADDPDAEPDAPSVQL